MAASRSHNCAPFRAASTKHPAGSRRRARVLEEQGARTLRAIVDYDEALALYRHARNTGSSLDRVRVRELLERAHSQFVEIGMTGWIPEAEKLAAEVG